MFTDPQDGKPQSNADRYFERTESRRKSRLNLGRQPTHVSRSILADTHKTLTAVGMSDTIAAV